MPQSGDANGARELSPVDEKPGNLSHLPCPRVNVPLSAPLAKQKNRSVIKSASVSGLSLMIPSGKQVHAFQSLFVTLDRWWMCFFIVF